MTAAKITSGAPVLLVRDVQAAADHYLDAVGFTYDRFWGDPPNFCIVQRNGQRLFLAQLDQPELGLTPHWKLAHKVSSAYFWVDDAEALYEEVQARGATIDWDLYITPYGVKEFGIQDLDGHDIAFGQVLHSEE